MGHVRCSEEMLSKVIIAHELIFIGKHWFIPLPAIVGILALLIVSPIYFWDFPIMVLMSSQKNNSYSST